MPTETDPTPTIVDLHLAGWTWHQINAELRISNSRALYQSYCATNPLADATEQRYTHYQRLEQLHKAHYPHALKADNDHTRTVLAVQKQQAALNPAPAGGEHAQTVMLAQAAQQALARLGMTPEFQADFGRAWQTELERLQPTLGQTARDYEDELAELDP